MKSKKSIFLMAALMMVVMLAAVAAGCGGQSRSTAEKFPTRPVEFIVPWGPGGGADQLARVSAKGAEGILKVSMPVLNVSGATGATGMAKLQAAQPDGHTISVYIADTHAVLTTGKASWKMDDIAPVAVMLKAPSYLFVKSDSPFKTWEDFEKAAKASPGKYKVATLGEGSVDDVTLKYLERKGIKVTGVPYPNPGERYTSVLGGHVDLVYEQAGDVRQYLEGKQIRPLIIFNEERWPSMKDIPCSKELGYEIYLPQFRSVIAKAGTDPKKLKVLSDAFKQVYDSPEYQKFLEEQYAKKDSYMGPDDARNFMLKEMQNMKAILGK